MSFLPLSFDSTQANHRKTRERAAIVLLVLSLLLALLPATITPSSALAQSERKQVLLINSYHPGYKWSDDITRALAEKFQEEGNIELRVEYLDTKHLDSREYLDTVYELLQTKYENNQPDLIMSSDDVALNFLFQHADTLFPNVPVVFVGANYFDEAKRNGYERFTGISEEADVAGTLDLAIQLHPKTRKLVVIHDKTVTGQKVHEKINELISQYPQISFEFVEDVTMDELHQYLGTLSPDTLVLLTVFFRDRNETFYEYDQFTSSIAKSSKVPVYGLWDFSLGYGIVGGKLTSGYTEGERAAELAIRILQGETSSSIPVQRQTQSQYLFDYAVMRKWDIPVSKLPDGSTVINKPNSFYEQNTLLVWTTLIGFVTLIFIIVFLSINNTQRRKAQSELAVRNQELQTIRNTLADTIADRTKDLATVAEVATATATILETSKLLQSAVDLTKERFGLYHSHIYLLDDAGENLVLTAGAGEPGRIMAAEKRSIPLSREQSLVARAAREGKGIIVNDVTEEPDFLPNPLLPKTRAELAVPMIVGGKVIGVFDVQSDQVGHFTDADVSVKTTLAAQVATSLQNVRSFEQASTQAELETLVNTIGQKIQRSTTVEDTLQIAVREIGLALGASRVKVNLTVPQSKTDSTTLN